MTTLKCDRGICPVCLRPVAVYPNGRPARHHKHQYRRYTYNAREKCSGCYQPALVKGDA